jgi:undecaprenyl-diphosphatase
MVTQQHDPVPGGASTADADRGGRVAPSRGADAGRVRQEGFGWRPVRHFAERSLLGLAAVIAAGLGFGVLLMLVRFHWAPLQHLDREAAADLNAMVAGNSPAVTVLKEISALGGRPIMMWLVTIAVALLLIRRRTRLAVYLVVTGLGALLLDPSVKALVGRLRPVVDVPVASAPGNSFPSGHALGSMVAYGALLLVFLPALQPRWRKPAIALVALIVLAVGLTRIALGVHYVSDVVAGWLLGAVWLSVTAYAFRVWRREVGRPERPMVEGLEPEAGHDISPAPGEGRLIPHPWAGAAEILVGWVFVFGTLYLMGLGVSYHAAGTFIATWDTQVPQWFAAHRTPRLDDVSWAWSKAGDTHAILLVSLVFCPLLVALWRRWRPVLFVVLTMVGELTLFLATSQAVDRPRPGVENLDGPMPTSSFPSGHIAATMCLYLAIAVLVVPRVRHWVRWVAVFLAVLMPTGVAVSRMYRGMHHPSDAAGALLLTLLWVGLLYWVVRPNADVAAGNHADAGQLGDADADLDVAGPGDDTVAAAAAR